VGAQTASQRTHGRSCPRWDRSEDSRTTSPTVSTNPHDAVRENGAYGGQGKTVGCARPTVLLYSGENTLQTRLFRCVKCRIATLACILPEKVPFILKTRCVALALRGRVIMRASGCAVPKDRTGGDSQRVGAPALTTRTMLLRHVWGPRQSRRLPRPWPRLALAVALYFLRRNGHPTLRTGNGNAQVKLAASLPFSTTRRRLCPAWQHRLGTKAKPSVLPAALLSQSLKNKVQFVLAVTGSASFSCLVTPTLWAASGHCGPHRPAARYFFRNRSGSVAKFAAIRRASSLVSILVADRRPGSSS
jgi:hypothetical protein